VTLAELNSLPASLAEAEFARCCGSLRWARIIAAARPFTTFDALLAAADRVWESLDTVDRLQAFAAHPRIGGQTSSSWSAEEQAGAASATEDIRERLARGNREYERRFGYTFLVCATGKSADEMLTLLERRLQHAAGEELPIAAGEQRKITHLRLRKLVTP
jgi:2-oxo-4-hydroxy-4-carboxy-5-ureidoimidazoline decarboxylase